MKKKTVTSETEEITIDNKKQKRKREKKAYRRSGGTGWITRHIFSL